MDIFVVMEERWSGEDSYGRDLYETTLAEYHGYFTDEEKIEAYIKGLNLKSTPKTHAANEKQRKLEHDRKLKAHNDHVAAAKLLADQGLKVNLGWTPGHPGKFVPQPYVEEYGNDYSYERLEPNDA